MSDRTMKCGVCGNETGAFDDHTCPAPAEGLDFERAPYGYSNKPRPRIEAFEGRLNAQHLAIVNRVREEARRDLFNKFWNASQDEKDGYFAARLGAWLTEQFDKLEVR